MAALITLRRRCEFNWESGMQAARRGRLSGPEGQLIGIDNRKN